jgi:hypothetical protein
MFTRSRNVGKSIPPLKMGGSSAGRRIETSGWANGAVFLLMKLTLQTGQFLL